MKVPILAQTAKTRGGTLEVPAVLGTKISRQQKKSGFFKNRARKGLPKSTQRIAETSLGVERHSKESGSGVFARDSEVEREELYSNEQKKSYRRPSNLELKLQKLTLLIDIVSLFVEKSHRSPSDLETRIAHRCSWMK